MNSCISRLWIFGSALSSVPATKPYTRLALFLPYNSALNIFWTKMESSDTLDRKTETERKQQTLFSLSGKIEQFHMMFLQPFICHVTRKTNTFWPIRLQNSAAVWYTVKANQTIFYRVKKGSEIPWKNCRKVVRCSEWWIHAVLF